MIEIRKYDRKLCLHFRTFICTVVVHLKMIEFVILNEILIKYHTDTKNIRLLIIFQLIKCHANHFRENLDTPLNKNLLYYSKMIDFSFVSAKSKTIGWNDILVRTW